MGEKVLEYAGQRITIFYDVARCIHAGECARGLPGVFDPSRKPWVNADGAAPEAVARVIHRCPTGALQYRSSELAPETPPEVNTVTVVADGPLHVRGDLELELPDGTSRRETRLALCRCGASKTRPLCDGSHTACGFSDAGELGRSTLRAAEPDAARGRLSISCLKDGPLRLRGPLELRSGSERQLCRGSEGYLCRCGASANRPFCDGSHKKVGFHD